ncbi:hypothetical protein DIPPA_32122 [Diplonema papillatum]|nr:hypothetical protein DIPPA_32122 [Diplonema papillatum]
MSMSGDAHSPQRGKSTKLPAAWPPHLLYVLSEDFAAPVHEQIGCGNATSDRRTCGGVVKV